MSSNTSLNPSGLSAEVTRKLATRQPAEHEKPILQGIREVGIPWVHWTMTGAHGTV